MLNEKIVWQPTSIYQPTYEFGILLDRKFAREMLEVTLSEKYRNRLNEMANETLQRKGEKWVDPLRFYENTALVTNFYIGNNGTWLELENPLNVKENISQSNEPLVYTSHNVDSSREAIALMALVDQWVTYSDAFKD